MTEYLIYLVVFAAPFPSLLIALLEFTKLHVLFAIFLAVLISPILTLGFLVVVVELIKRISNLKIQNRIAPVSSILFLTPLVITTQIASQFLTYYQQELDGIGLLLLSILSGVGLLLIGIVIVVVIGALLVLVFHLYYLLSSNVSNT